MKTSQNGAASGPMLLLRSLGFDPSAIMANIESAKTTANDVMTHFDRRLTAIESRLELIHAVLTQRDKVQ